MSSDTSKSSSSSKNEFKIKEEQGKDLELKFVKSTYDAIADDFSSTRYKKWPRVDAYLQSLPRSNLLLDLGCGNGKYLDNSHTYNIGCDLSLNLLKICKAKGFEVVLCDMTRLPFRQSVFDSVISIAAIHHLTTNKRRQKCLEDMIDLLDPSCSSCLIQVWSFEQDLEKNNPYLKNRLESSEGSLDTANLFRIDGELKLPIHQNRTPFQEQDVLVPFHSKSTNQIASSDDFSRRLRYYHVFRQGELDEMFKQIQGINISQSYYDKGNWSVVAVKGCAITQANTDAKFTQRKDTRTPVSVTK